MGAHRGYRERNYAFGQQLLTLRTRAGLTQIALAAQIGVNRRSVLNWETGELYPKAETLQRLIAVLLAQGVFTAGQEAEQAAQLWQQASQDAPHPLAAFDAASFARLLAERSSTPAPAHAPPTPLAPATALDRLLPEGLVTFLATDIEGSTKRWEHFPQAMQQALVRHHAILHQLTELYDGQVFHTAGDSFICVFADAAAALQSALALQRALLAEPWPEVVAPLLIRMALHSGAATTQGEEYVAEPTLNRLSRVLELSQGGQILLTQATLDLIGARWPEGVTRHHSGGAPVARRDRADSALAGAGARSAYRRSVAAHSNHRGAASRLGRGDRRASAVWTRAGTGHTHPVGGAGALPGGECAGPGRHRQVGSRGQSDAPGV